MFKSKLDIIIITFFFVINLNQIVFASQSFKPPIKTSNSKTIFKIEDLEQTLDEKLDGEQKQQVIKFLNLQPLLSHRKVPNKEEILNLTIPLLTHDGVLNRIIYLQGHGYRFMGFHNLTNQDKGNFIQTDLDKKQIKVKKGVDPYNFNTLIAQFVHQLTTIYRPVKYMATLRAMNLQESNLGLKEKSTNFAQFITQQYAINYIKTFKILEEINRTPATEFDPMYFAYKQNKSKKSDELIEILSKELKVENKPAFEYYQAYYSKAFSEDKTSI